MKLYTIYDITFCCLVTNILNLSTYKSYSCYFFTGKNNKKKVSQMVKLIKNLDLKKFKINKFNYSEYNSVINLRLIII